MHVGRDQLKSVTRTGRTSLEYAASFGSFLFLFLFLFMKPAFLQQVPSLNHAESLMLPCCCQSIETHKNQVVDNGLSISG